MMPMISMEVDLKSIHGSKKKGDTELKAIDGDGFVSGVAQCQHWDTAPCTMTHEETHEHKTWVSTAKSGIENIEEKRHKLKTFFLFQPTLPNISDVLSTNSGGGGGGGGEEEEGGGGGGGGGEGEEQEGGEEGDRRGARSDFGEGSFASSSTYNYF